jgi:hypothetical protein
MLEERGRTKHKNRMGTGTTCGWARPSGVCRVQNPARSAKRSFASVFEFVGDMAFMLKTRDAWLTCPSCSAAERPRDHVKCSVSRSARRQSVRLLGSERTVRGRTSLASAWPLDFAGQARPRAACAAQETAADRDDRRLSAGCPSRGTVLSDPRSRLTALMPHAILNGPPHRHPPRPRLTQTREES